MNINTKSVKKIGIKFSKEMKKVHLVGTSSLKCNADIMKE